MQPIHLVPALALCALRQHCQLFAILCDGGHRMRELISEDFGEELELYFGSPDFIGRIDKILHFNQLAIESLESIHGMCTDNVSFMAEQTDNIVGGQKQALSGGGGGGSTKRGGGGGKRRGQ